MNLKEKSQLDNQIMTIAKVQEIRHVLAHTNKGDLCLMLKKGGTEFDYQFVLDAVPYPEQENKELLELYKQYE